MLYAITGGTGSFGSALAKHLLATTSHHLRLLSRDEHKQNAMMADYPPSDRLTYVLCDIGDLDRLRIAFHKVDVVVHAAAVKTVPAGELHTAEMVRVNVNGTSNVINAALDNCVTKSLIISSDKSVNAVNNYGKGKGVAEALFVSANMLGTSYGSIFSVVRGGNIWGSRGSVVERWLSQPVISITNPDVTRFHLPMPKWLSFCMRAIDEMRGGEIFVPKCNAWRLYDLAVAFTQSIPGKRVTQTSHRYGDKIHETLIAEHEIPHTIDLDWGYCIEPNPQIRSVWNYVSRLGQPLRSAYSSDIVPALSVKDLKYLITETWKAGEGGTGK